MWRKLLSDRAELAAASILVVGVMILTLVAYLPFYWLIK